MSDHSDACLTGHTSVHVPRISCCIRKAMPIVGSLKDVQQDGW